MKNLIKQYISEKLEAKGKELDIPAWLDSAAKRASQISVVTHVLKYTNSEARGTNIRAEQNTYQKDEEGYISTSCLENITQDVVGNAAALDVAGLLQLEQNGVSLLQMIANDDGSAFEDFTDSRERLLSWLEGFKAVLNPQSPCSHTLAKQIYFPLEEGGYHLLEPLYASSLSHEIYNKVKHAKYSEEAKLAREHKRKGTFSDFEVLDFPKLAIQTFGGTKPQNVSKLNSVRGGKSYLLRSMPPVWKNVRTPPLDSNAFWRELTRKLYKNIIDLKEFLTFFQDWKNNFEIRQKRAHRLDKFIENALTLVDEMHTLEPGWSLHSKLKPSEKIWLDPEAEEHSELIHDDEWKKNISKDFSTWLVHKLNSKKEKVYVLGDDEIRHIENKCLEALKEMV